MPKLAFRFYEMDPRHSELLNVVYNSYQIRLMFVDREGKT